MGAKKEGVRTAVGTCGGEARREIVDDGPHRALRSDGSGEAVEGGDTACEEPAPWGDIRSDTPGCAASRAELFGLGRVTDRASLRDAACRSVAVASHLEMLLAPAELDPVDWRAWLAQAGEAPIAAVIASVNDYLAGPPDFDDEELVLMPRDLLDPATSGGLPPGDDRDPDR